MNSYWKNLLEKIDSKIEAECIRLGEQIPYRTTDGVYGIDYAQKDIYWWTRCV